MKRFFLGESLSLARPFLGKALFLARPFLGEALFLRPLRASDAALFLEIVQIVEQLPAVHEGLRSGRYDRAIGFYSGEVCSNRDNIVPVMIS